MYSQLTKFIKVTFLVVQQYARIFYNYKKARAFFLDMLYAFDHRVYDKKQEVCVEQAVNETVLPDKKLTDLFPSICSCPVFTYTRYFEFSYDKRLLLLSDFELIVVNSLVKSLAPNKILELGTYQAALTYNFWLNSDAEITTVDLKRFDTDEIIEKSLSDPRVRRIISNSHELTFDNKFDFVFIDAGHYYDDVKSDSELALQSISDGGVILWHDYIEDMPGVFRYLNELKDRYDICRIEGTSLALIHNTGELK